MKILISGGAGFIGSHLTKALLADGHSVTVVDDLSLGRLSHIEPFKDVEQFRFHKGSILDGQLMDGLCSGIETVFHLAANSDIEASSADNRRDFEVGTLGTFTLLNACRKSSVKQILFASTSAIYGEPTVRPTPEDYGPLLPVSHYGASKLAAEGMISAFCANYGMQAWIFRFANIVGPNATHGVIYDFLKRLKANPRELKILGDGSQQKSYLHVDDCVDSMLFCWHNALEQVNVFNLAHKGTARVSEIADITTAVLGLKKVKYNYTGGDRGWIGDVPKMEVSAKRLNALGWQASMDSRQAVMKAAEQIAAESG